jgi:hypothetical protein
MSKVAWNENASCEPVVVKEIIRTNRVHFSPSFSIITSEGEIHGINSEDVRYIADCICGLLKEGGES